MNVIKVLVLDYLHIPLIPYLVCIQILLLFQIHKLYHQVNSIENYVKKVESYKFSNNL
jgi:hypothetical protein